MYSAGNSSRTILLELEEVIHPPSQLTLEQIEEWLSIQTSIPEETKHQIALVLLHRYCYIDTPWHQPSLPEISKRLNLTIDQTRKRITRGLKIMQTEPRFSAVEKSGLLVSGSQFYIILFGCDCLNCLESYAV